MMIYKSLSLALVVSAALVLPVCAQEKEVESIDLADVVEHIADDSSEVIAQAGPESGVTPLARIAEEAVNFIAKAKGQSGGMCPVLRKWSGGGCGVSSVLSGENALTDEQYEKLYQIKMEMKDELGPMMVQYKSNKRHLNDMMTQEEIDTKAVKKLQEKMGSLKKDVSIKKLDYKLQMAQVLTGAQRSELRKAMIKKMSGCSRGSGSMMRSWMMKRYMGR